MSIAFFNLISDDFHRKLSNSSSFDNKVDPCVDQFHEYMITFHGKRKCDLERFQVSLFFEDIEACSKDRRKSNHLLKKAFVNLCEKYPIGFRDCVSIAQVDIL